MPAIPYVYGVTGYFLRASPDPRARGRGHASIGSWLCNNGSFWKRTPALERRPAQLSSWGVLPRRWRETRFGSMHAPGGRLPQPPPGCRSAHRVLYPASNVAPLFRVDESNYRRWPVFTAALQYCNVRFQSQISNSDRHRRQSNDSTMANRCHPSSLPSDSAGRQMYRRRYAHRPSFVRDHR